MKLKNILIVVKDIEKSREFYHKLFGIDLDGNLIEVGTPLYSDFFYMKKSRNGYYFLIR